MVDQNLFRSALLILLTGVAVIYDLRWRKIPNQLIAMLFIPAIVFGAMSSRWYEWLLSAMVGFALFVPGYFLKKVGAADVKLVAAVCAFFPLQNIVVFCLSIYIVGAVCGLCFIYYESQLRSFAIGRNFDFWQAKIIDKLSIVASKLIGVSYKQQASKTSALLPYSVPIAITTYWALYAHW